MEKHGCLYTIGFILGAIIAVFGLLCLISWIAMLSWNYAIPVFWAKAPILNFWQTFCILLLIHIIVPFRYKYKIDSRA